MCDTVRTGGLLVGLVVDSIVIDRTDIQRVSDFWQAALNPEDVWTGP